MLQNTSNSNNDSSCSLNCVKCETNCDTYESKIDNISPLFESDDIICQSTLELNGKTVEAYLTSTEICWFTTTTTIKPNRKESTVKYIINVVNVIYVKYEQKPATKEKEENDIELFPSQYFGLHFGKRIKHKWKPQFLLFYVSDTSKCQAWVEGIKNILKEFQRPKRLLAFINPVGGKKLAQKIYRENSAPYFDIANVNVTTIITERINHARDYISSEDMSVYDGVLCVGGDGLCSEIVNGMLHYKNGSHEIKMTADTKPLMLGIIPAGSTDTVAFCTCGTNDPITATLHIILGHKLALDICSVWQNGTFLKYSMSLMGYGYFGDLIKDSENLRWMGPKRYDFAGFKKFMTNKSYDGEVRFIKADESDHLNERIQCKAECKRCSTFYDDKDSPDDKEIWQTVSGKFISVIGANMSCRCERSSTGISPLAHTGDGYIDLILIRKTTRAKYLRHLIKVSEKTVDQFDFNFIEVYRVKEFMFNPIQAVESNSHVDDQVLPQSETSVWNVDGELVESPTLRIMVHRQLISLYARGIEE